MLADMCGIDAHWVRHRQFGATRSPVGRPREIVAKRQTNKSALTAAGVLIELFVVNTLDDLLLTKEVDDATS